MPPKYAYSVGCFSGGGDVSSWLTNNATEVCILCWLLVERCVVQNPNFLLKHTGVLPEAERVPSDGVFGCCFGVGVELGCG